MLLYHLTPFPISNPFLDRSIDTVESCNSIGEVKEIPLVTDVADTSDPRSAVFLGSFSSRDELLARVKASSFRAGASLLDSADSASGL
jgi:hypothetical protein